MEEWREKMNREHYEKYDALAREIGIEALKSLIPATPEEITAALSTGDTALNTIPLRQWDKAAGRFKPDKRFMVSHDFRMSFSGVFTRQNAARLSLAERVCVLKHVAAHYYI